MPTDDKDWRNAITNNYSRVDTELAKKINFLVKEQIAAPDTTLNPRKHKRALKKLANADINLNLFNGARGDNKLSPADLGFKVIIGDDDRTAVGSSSLPFKAICLLEITGQDNASFLGTGFFIAPKCVITAGHCVYFSGDWAKNITVIPGATGPGTAPFGQQTSSKFESVAGWTVNGDQSFDYGCILLPDETLYNSIGSALKYKVEVSETAIAIAGYPIDKSKTQWKSTGHISNRGTYKIEYDLDTLEGNSGSPLFADPDGNFTVFGVHVHGSNPNFGVRVTADVETNWQKWSV